MNGIRADYPLYSFSLQERITAERSDHLCPFVAIRESGCRLIRLDMRQLSR